ncbi:MAG: tRNA (N(6)-L-threonylcarbamoyladenosine(37)-C(2))-methylthiotransferase MtaB [Nitrospinota bacterium]|nr:tRNA (N(6)-L-threonylcarbamoyladenosine(37)-C(2))-methylthiotransferase MtaB [Nitrospinota bacterium]
MEKAKIITCGCRFNRYESDEIKERLNPAGERKLVIINSCAVTSKSEAKSRYAVRRAVKENPGAAIVVGGCWAELDPEAVKAIEGVDLVLGNEEKFRVNEFGADKNGETEVHTGAVKAATDFIESRVGGLTGRTAAYLKIQNGCGEICSFCVVRIARGKSRSATPEFVQRRIDELADGGAREIVLTGINIGEYGNDIPGAPTLASILKRGAKRKDVRFRLSSINPREVTEELIAVISDNENICKHLHIPMQSGSDAVLKRMNRPYTADDYKRKIEMVAAALPDAGIGCDILAGFPGETEEEFSETAEMLASLPFSYAHVFTYSDRPQSTAHGFDGKLAENVKKERMLHLKSIADEKNRLFRERFIGKRLSILVEEKSTKAGHLKGKSDNFISVEIDGGGAVRGSLIEITAESLTETGLRGKIA